MSRYSNSGTNLFEEFLLDQESFRPGSKMIYQRFPVFTLQYVYGILLKTAGRYKKTKIPASLRNKILKRDLVCQKCSDPDANSVDHIISEFHGGKMILSNLQLLCRKCNSRKGKSIYSATNLKINS